MGLALARHAAFMRLTGHLGVDRPGVTSHRVSLFHIRLQTHPSEQSHQGVHCMLQPVMVPTGSKAVICIEHRQLLGHPHTKTIRRHCPVVINRHREPVPVVKVGCAVVAVVALFPCKD